MLSNGSTASDRIGRLLAETDASRKDVVILYRTNAQSRALEDALRREAIPYQIIGGTRFYERREVRDLLAYLKFSARLGWSLQKMLRLLQLNLLLFMRRDLMALLRGDPPEQNGPDNRQLCLV